MTDYKVVPFQKRKTTFSSFYAELIENLSINLCDNIFIICCVSYTAGSLIAHLMNAMVVFA